MWAQVFTKATGFWPINIKMKLFGTRYLDRMPGPPLRNPPLNVSFTMLLQMLLLLPLSIAAAAAA